MTKLVTLYDRHGMLFPFVRRGLEKHVRGMEVPKLELQEPLNASEGTLTIVGFKVDSAIERDLLLDVTIDGIRITRGYVQAGLLQTGFLRAIVVPIGRRAEIEVRAMALRDMHVDAAFSVLASRPVNR